MVGPSSRKSIRNGGRRTCLDEVSESVGGKREGNEDGNSMATTVDLVEQETGISSVTT